jgi:DNA polymerase V
MRSNPPRRDTREDRLTGKSRKEQRSEPGRETLFTSSTMPMKSSDRRTFSASSRAPATFSAVPSVRYTSLLCRLRDFPSATSTVRLVGAFSDTATSGLSIPFFESVSAGFPSPAEDFEDRGLDLNELMIRNPPATYMLRVVGESMTGAGIFDGDLLVVDRSLEPKDGDIVIACLDNAFTVKRLRRLPDRVVLQAENPAHPPIEVLGDLELHLFGVVTNRCVDLKN